MQCLLVVVAYPVKLLTVGGLEYAQGSSLPVYTQWDALLWRA